MERASRLKETEMNTNPNQRSATVYQFPRGGRAAMKETRPAREQMASDVGEEIYSSSGWYHEEAIRDSNPNWEH
jgi:Protein of unknown function (DUF2735)